MGSVSYVITTFTGKEIDPWDLDPDLVDIQDIAHALGNTCRYGGHCKHFYSVAQHSLLVSSLCPPQFALWGLLHDASEAYLMDLPAPFKAGGSIMAGEYRAAESRAMRVIARKFGLPEDMPPVVHTADQTALWAEMAALMPTDGLCGHHPDTVLRLSGQTFTPLLGPSTQFMARFQILRTEQP